MRKSIGWMLLAGLGVVLLGCAETEGASPDVAGGADFAVADETAAPSPGFRVGVAQVEVTPEGAVPLGGYGVGGGSAEGTRWSEGVHDPLVAVAFAVEDRESGEYLILVGLDALGLMKPEQERVRASFLNRYEAVTGSPLAARGHLLVSSSHSHACPDVVGIYSPGVGELVGRDEAYVDRLVENVAEAALQAWLGRVDASLRVGRGWRDNHTDVHSEANPMEMDGRLFVLGAWDERDALLGTATVWGAHPTVLPESSRALSADWVGAFRHRMAERLGGLHAHLQGAVGGVYPHKPSWEMGGDELAAMFADCPHEDPFVEGWLDPDVDPRHYDLAACVGYDVAEVAIDALEEAAPVAETGLALRPSSFEVVNQNMLFYAASAQGLLARAIPSPAEELPLPTDHLWARLGQLQLATAPGEAFPGYFAALRALLVAHGAEEQDVIIVGLGGDWLGYLLRPEQYGDDEYGYHRGLSAAPDVLPRQLAALEVLLSAP